MFFEVMSSVADLIKKYLESQSEKTKNLGTDWIVVKNGHDIVVDYIWRLDHENVFDTSVEHIAKAVWKYNEHRDYSSGLPFKVGIGQMIKWFDKWVVGMKVGETKTIEIPAAEAYGEHNPDFVMEVAIAHLPKKEWGYVAGDYLYTQQGQRLVISEVGEKDVTIDQNHELAWKDLIFDITIKDIK